MNSLIKDLRFGIRQLAAKPGFAVAAILTLALGIGANTAVFSVLNGYLFKPLPYPNSGRLVQIDENFSKLGAGSGTTGMGMPLYFEIKNQVDSLSDAALYETYAYNLQHAGRARRATGAVATASLFGVLGVKPLLGRIFNSENEQTGNARVVVLSYALWQSLFGGSPDAIGKTIRLDGRIYRVTAVMPRGFAFPGRGTRFWKPLVITAANRDVQRFGPRNYNMIGRLKPGASVAAMVPQLNAVVEFVHRSMTAKDWQQLESFGFTIVPSHYRQALLGTQAATLLLLQFAVLLVLLIACVNVANLLLARVLARSHELTLRAALGASRGVLARQLLAEALCLAVPGGAVGIGLGWLALALIGRSGLVAAGDIFNITPDWRVGLFAFIAICVTAMLVSLAPMHRLSRADLQTLLQEGGQRMAGGRRARRIRTALVVVELALATALLSGAGLLLHSFVNLQATQTGFNKNNILMAGLLVPRKDHAGDAALSSFYRHLLTRVDAMPSVASASITSCVPLCHTGLPGEYVRVRGYKPPVDAPYPTAGKITIAGAYFKTLGIPILRGRGFDARDTAASQLVAVVNQSLAEQYFSGEDPIGRQIYISDPGKWYTIVGIVPTVKIQHIREAVPQRIVYVSSSQGPLRTMHLAINTAVPPGLLAQPLNSLLHDIDPAIAVFDVQTMHARLADALQGKRTTMTLVVAFGTIALALAMIGVYGVMSYAVGQRRAECGVRLALGALPEDLTWLVLKDGFKLLAVGLTLGLALAVLIGYLLASKLFGVAPFDPVTLGGTAIVLALITTAACWLPARRAAKLDPAVALQE